MAVTKYHLPDGDYSLDFIRALSMAAHLKLIDPSELTFLFEDDTTVDQIMKLLYDRVVKNRDNYKNSNPV